jgi:hypothetical protein
MSTVLFAVWFMIAEGDLSTENLEVYKVAADALRDLWAAYSLAALAFVGFVFRDGKLPSRQSLQALSIAFTAFAAGNSLALHKSQSTLVAAASVIQESYRCDLPDARRLVAACALEPNSVGVVMTFYLVTVVLFLLAVWVPRTRADRSVETTHSGQQEISSAHNI